MTTPDSYWRVKDLFVEAIDRPPAERDEFVRSACKDDARLFEEIGAMLAAHDRAAGLLTQPTAHPARAFPAGPPPDERIGQMIGPYKLLQVIGEGGFGSVYMAEQEAPVRRRVALKIIKLGMDTRQVIARFEAERQALALMDHAGVAKVFDAGSTSTGRPYFVMELVKGEPITDYCDKNNLSINRRLELFIQVCQAVQHAHQKGLIHRDIKPSNILVSTQDDRPVAKVIDFGIAKATQSRLTEKTLFTEFRQLIGTPEYMSPEQAEATLDIDTRSDVYSLGVLLYELLTGATPFDARELRSKAYTEIQRIIREVEPPKPSTRLSTLDALPSVAAHRSVEPRKLAACLRGELDWIVMKCLEKDRSRRYESASGVAAEIRRYLDDEPVTAGPPSAWYRFRKSARRNRVALVTASLVMAAVLIGAALATWQAVVANSARKDALAAASTAKLAKEYAEARLAEQRAVLDFVENKVFAAARPEGQAGGLGRQVTLREAIESALTRIEGSFRDQPLMEARIRATIGLSFSYLGDYQKAQEQLIRARQLFVRELGVDHSDTMQVSHRLANSYGDLGQFAEATALHEQTLALRQAKLGPQHRETLMSMENLANSYYALGRYEDTLKLQQAAYDVHRAQLGPDHPDTIASMHNLSSAYEAVGRRDDAMRLREETLRLMKAQLGPTHPDTLKAMMSLSVSYSSAGRHDEALKLRLETVELMRKTLGPDHPHTLIGLNNLASCYEQLGQHEEALKLREETLRLRKAKLGPDHPEIILSMGNVAFSLVTLHRDDEAVNTIDDCIQRSAGKTVDPRVVPWLMDLRLRVFQKKNDAAGCRDTARRWENLNRTDAENLYTAACMRAVTDAVIRAGDKSQDAARQADAESDQAMIWLKQALAAGYDKFDHMRKDKDLDALRERDDFERLLATHPTTRQEIKGP